MHAQNFVLSDYLARVHFEGEATNSLACLQHLMRAHLQNIPFENLDVQAGKIVSLAPEDIVNKIVYGERGGYCYEMNGLFAMALTDIGFDYKIIGARPMFYPQRRPKTHVGLLVTVDNQQWLCDTGFGSFGLRAPIGLHQTGEIIHQDHETFSLTLTEQGEYVLSALVKGEWATQFGFDLHPMEWVDFMLANYFNSTHPDAVFVQRHIVMQQRPNSRTLLSGDQLKQMNADGETVTTINPEELDDVLWREFKLRRP
jgi:N-hydroxyarylamine O-acetyltransferase